VHTTWGTKASRRLHRLRSDFFAPDARATVGDHVRAYPTCQKNKSEQLHLTGLLQPLVVSSAVWCYIMMDFIEDLPCVNSKSIILTVVERLWKYAYFVALSHPYTATSVAWAFFDSIVHLHDILRSIVSDRDLVFMSKFWMELFQLSVAQLNLTSSFHPQADGQLEDTNRIIVMHHRCLTSDQPRRWLQWLLWAEFCYNSAYQSSLRTSPF
jgi:hypothetical protein